MRQPAIACYACSAEDDTKTSAFDTPDCAPATLQASIRFRPASRSRRLWGRPRSRFVKFPGSRQASRSSSLRNAERSVSPLIALPVRGIRSCKAERSDADPNRNCPASAAGPSHVHVGYQPHKACAPGSARSPPPRSRGSRSPTKSTPRALSETRSLSECSSRPFTRRILDSGQLLRA
jgi:hypothetical protein